MAQPQGSEFLTGAESVEVRQALGNELLMNGLRKIFHFEAKLHAESVENEALSNEPNTHLMIQYAARTRAAREWMQIVRMRLEVLTVKQR